MSSTPEKLLKGQGQFVSNLNLPGLFYAAFVRSPYAHARILSIECSTAKAELGDQLIAIFTGDDIEALMPVPNPAMPKLEGELIAVLPKGLASFCGQAIAVVVATSAQAAQDAADAIDMEFEPLEPGTREVQVQVKQSRTQATATNAIKVGTTICLPRVSACPMETRATVMQYSQSESGDDMLHAWMGTQSPDRAREHLEQALGIKNIRVTAPDVGGAFGAKASLSPEEISLAIAAKRLFEQTGKLISLKWVASRSEDFLASMHGRGATLTGDLDVTADGTLVHLNVSNRFEQGAWYAFSSAVPAMNSLRILPGPYKLSSVAATATQIRANATATNIYRGAGRPEAAILVERLIDQAALALKRDPLEYRLSQVLQRDQFPFTNAVGQEIDSANFPLLLHRCAELFDYRRRREAQSITKETLTGIGIACYLEPCGQGFESATVRLNAEGTLVIASGSATQGQRHELSYQRIAADTLGLSIDAIEVIQGDTQLCPPGIGALASRSTAIGGSAVLAACQEIKQRKASGASLPITAQVKYTAPAEAWASGVVMVQVQIDRATGELVVEKLCWVDDAGRIISPESAKAQLIGGMAQGIGQATMEAIHYDAFGQLLTGSLMDYAVPRASDVPDITLESICTPTQANLLGAKGVGEAGCIGMPAALLNAVCDALKDAPKIQNGNTLHFPLTSYRIWELLQN